MADIEFDAIRGMGGVQPAPAFRTVLSWAGGALSLTLAAGLVVWGYHIMVRDVTGVPVVRALEGPYRLAPDDPGGSPAAHQGLAVNRVTAEGEAAPPPNTLRLAPQPVSLTEEDQPRAVLRPDELAAFSGPEGAGAVPVALLPGDAPEVALAAPPEAAEALSALPEPDMAVPGTLVVLPPGALPQSPRPPARPDGDLAAQAALAAAAAALAPRTPVEMPAREIIAGTPLVQLGAFENEDEAHEVWDGLAGQGSFAAFFVGKSRVLQEAETGGRRFYRLRAAGFSDLADARRFCAALTAEGTDCIPVTAR